jgi:hypothetical protein
VESVLLRGKAFLARREFLQGRAWVEQALQRHPGYLPLLILHSHLLLQEDKDPSEAERGLSTILQRDPANTQAKYNPELLSRRLTAQGRKSFRRPAGSLSTRDPGDP